MHKNYCAYRNIQTNPHLPTELPGVSVDRVGCRKNLLIVSCVCVLLPGDPPQPSRVGWF